MQLSQSGVIILLLYESRSSVSQALHLGSPKSGPPKRPFLYSICTQPPDYTPGGRFCNVFKFRDGRIMSLHIYLDPDYTGEDEARFRWRKNRKW
ncbi:MAG: hypothetical protein DMG53_02535 [Acidobacteria bacterium]|nr:MAG: hypothetical protein DMG53_02535 [Acidobacteriota bacterium]